MKSFNLSVGSFSSSNTTYNVTQCGDTDKDPREYMGRDNVFDEKKSEIWAVFYVEYFTFSLIKGHNRILIL